MEQSPAAPDLMERGERAIDASDVLSPISAPSPPRRERHSPRAWSPPPKRVVVHRARSGPTGRTRSSAAKQKHARSAKPKQMPAPKKRSAEPLSNVNNRQRVEPAAQVAEPNDAVVPASIWAPLAVPTHSDHTDPCWRILDDAIIHSLQGNRRGVVVPRPRDVLIHLTWYVWARDFLVPIGSHVDAAVTYEHHQQSIKFAVYDLHLLDHLREPRSIRPGAPANVLWHLLNREYHPPEHCSVAEGRCLHGSGCAIVPPMLFCIRPNPKPTNRAVSAVHFDHISLTVRFNLVRLVPMDAEVPPTTAPLPQFAQTKVRVIRPLVVEHPPD